MTFWLNIDHALLVDIDVFVVLSFEAATVFVAVYYLLVWMNIKVNSGSLLLRWRLR